LPFNYFMMKKVFSIPNLVYFLFPALYILWVLLTYRNIIHMDMIEIVGTKVKHLFEHDFHLADLVYEPIFPCSTSIIFTLINAKLFHLNTVIEIVIGASLLAVAGYIYLSRMSFFLADQRQKFLFALLTGFLVFGLHKWEASFTSFFSFAISFNLVICFLNYFFLLRYIEPGPSAVKSYCIPLMIFSNLLVIFEAEAYFFGYILAILALLLLIRRYKLAAFDKKRWNTVVVTSLSLLIFAVLLTTWLKSIPDVKQGVLKPSITGFAETFFHRPLWITKFYLLAQSGPFLGEAFDHVGLRTLAGGLVLVAYGLAVAYVIRKKDRRLFVMVAMIFYNIISCGMVTLGRYVTNVVEFGASSRYTVFNLSGVLGLTTIIFFYLLDEGKSIYKKIAWSGLGLIIVAYLYVDKRQLKIAPYRTANFGLMRQALLTGEGLDILQDKPAASLEAIAVLKKYRLNVYYGQTGMAGDGVLRLEDLEKITLASGTAAFNALIKSGFYEDERGISWTNGKASLILDQPIETGDSLVMQLNTYMPPACKNVHPRLSWFDTDNKEHIPVRTVRKGDVFDFFFYSPDRADCKRIILLSETIDGRQDARVLSFPFISLEIKNRPF
jgi:hypothetical protein